ncbi:MAG: hypothetical protein JO257_16835 [Deltaproteobacteria bacterium]|nr:hypothetical protein [Deltaproteobacteria bacterium]
MACAALAARAVASLSVAMYLAPEARASVSSSPLAPAPAKAKVRPDSNAFVARNMFCSTCAPVAGPGPTDSFIPDATLIATSVGAARACTLRTGFVFGTFGEGDHVPGIGTLDHVSYAYCDFSDGNRHGRLTFGGEPVAATTDKPPAEKDPWDGRLKKIDDHTFEVDRSLVRELVSGATKPGAVRITPIPGDNGQLAGLRFGAVREGSLPASLGIKNGDLISEINGAHIANANTLLDVLAKLDQLNVVEVDGTRAGKPLGITLRLR